MQLSREKSRSILLVEDNRVNQEITVAQLESFGMTDVDLADNGTEALAAVNKKVFSLILMDCQMPVMDGFEATKQIRDLEINQNRYSPIIALTSNYEAGYREKCLHAGMNDYIKKPVKLDDLKRVIFHWIGNSCNYSEHGVPAKYSGIDKEVLNELSMLRDRNGISVLNRLSKVYIEKISETLDLLSIAFQEKRVQEMKELAHNIKSSSAVMGASRLVMLCYTLENASDNDDPANEFLLQELKWEFKRVESMLNDNPLDR